MRALAKRGAAGRRRGARPAPRPLPRMPGMRERVPVGRDLRSGARGRTSLHHPRPRPTGLPPCGPVDPARPERQRALWLLARLVRSTRLPELLVRGAAWSGTAPGHGAAPAPPPLPLHPCSPSRCLPRRVLQRKVAGPARGSPRPPLDGVACSGAASWTGCSATCTEPPSARSRPNASPCARRPDRCAAERSRPRRRGGRGPGPGAGQRARVRRRRPRPPHRHQQRGLRADAQVVR